jgi:hypothetical protein
MDFGKAIHSIPNALHVSILDADEKEHDAVLASNNFDRNAGQFGITQRGQDALFVAVGALPIDLTEGGKVTYKTADGKEVRRRIDDVSACPYFLQIHLGETC